MNGNVRFPVLFGAAMKLRFVALFIAACVLQTNLDAQQPLQHRFQGVAFGAVADSQFRERDDYVDLLDESVLNAIQVGANSVAVDLNLPLVSVTAGVPAPNGIESQLGRLAPVVDAAQSRGLDVFLRTNVVLPSLDFESAAIMPDDVDAWFAGYRSAVLDAADFASERNIPMFSVGGGLNSLETREFTDRWSSLVAEVRSRYSGDITYASDLRFHPQFGGGYDALPWWGELDVIGINANAGLTFDFNAIEGDLLLGAVELIDEIEDWRDSENVDQRVVLANVGYVSADGGATLGVDPRQDNNVDLPEQQHAYAAMLTALQKRDWLDGSFWNGWSEDPHGGGAGDVGLSPQRKPAEEELAQNFGGRPNFVLRPSLIASWDDDFEDWHVPNQPPGVTGDLNFSTEGVTAGSSSLIVPSPGGSDLAIQKIWALQGSETYTLMQIASDNIDNYVLEIDATFDHNDVASAESELVVVFEDDSDIERTVSLRVTHEQTEGLETVRLATPLSSFAPLNPESLFYEMEIGTDNEWMGSVFIDNLRLRSTIAGDVTNDAVVDDNDIDALSDALRHGLTDEQYDLNLDGTVDGLDRTEWSALSGIVPGDFDLNGVVETRDFLVVSQNFNQPGNWRDGDANGDRIVSIQDFLALSRNFGRGAAVRAVPEPTAWWLVVYLIPLVAGRLRTNNR